MLGPGIDEGHVLAGLHHVGAGIAADRARADDGDLPAHGFSPAFFLWRRIQARPLVRCTGYSSGSGGPAKRPPVAIALFSLDARGQPGQFAESPLCVGSRGRAEKCAPPRALPATVAVARARSIRLYDLLRDRTDDGNLSAARNRARMTETPKAAPAEIDRSIRIHDRSSRYHRREDRGFHPHRGDPLREGSADGSARPERRTRAGTARQGAQGWRADAAHSARWIASHAARDRNGPDQVRPLAAGTAGLQHHGAR